LVAHISRSELQRALNKPPDQLAAYECWLRGNAIMKNWHSDTTGASIVEAREFFDRARAIDPNYAPPFHGLAWTYLASWIEPWRQPAIAAEYQKPETLNAALTFAQRAIELDPNLADAHRKVLQNSSAHWRSIQTWLTIVLGWLSSTMVAPRREWII
jgi:tetratricopeptide (TPR) repeat protein